MESRKPSAEIMQVSHCFEGRLHVHCGDFWKGLYNEIELKFHTHYQVTQNYMNVGKIPHITR
jgi:hypothetical protein